jgi:hypothetical protein
LRQIRSRQRREKTLAVLPRSANLRPSRHRQRGEKGMFGNRIKIEDELFEKVKQCAAAAGYSSPDEFVAHVLEKEIARRQAPAEDDRDPTEEVKKRLQGLGYIE